MKVCIIGSNSFLANSIGRYCNFKGYELDVYGLEAPTQHRYNDFIQINLMKDQINYSNLVDYDIIIYACGAGIQANLNEGVDLIYGLNVTAPIQICNGLRLVDYRGIFITFGSVFEIGETTESKFFTEEEILLSTCHSPNEYTVSKRTLSRFVESYTHQFTHWHFYIPTIYGEQENPKRLIPYTVNAIKRGEELHFTAGDQTRQYVYVDEVPKLLDLAYTKNLPSGLYNIEGKETLTVKEIVTLIHNKMGKELPNDCFGSFQRADVGMKYLALDGLKLRNAIGFQATISIVDVINKY